MADARVLCQLINAYIYKIGIMKIKSYRLRLVAIVLLIMPFNILGILLARVLPKNADLYLDNVLTARKK